MNRQKTLEHYQNVQAEAENYMKTASIDKVHGDEDQIEIPKEVREAKIAELARSMFDHSSDTSLVKAMEFCGTKDEVLFDTFVSLIVHVAPATDKARDVIGLGKIHSLLFHAQSLREMVTEAALEYAEHLYDEGQY